MEIKRIYHLHHKICGHASNTVESILNNALRSQYERLYMTEHCPVPNLKILYRAPLNEISEVRKDFLAINGKYGKLRTYYGYEVEYPKHNRHIFESLKDDPRCDYFIYGPHYYGDMWAEKYRSTLNGTHTVDQLNEYLAMAIDACKSGLFSLFAHPDLFINSYRKWDENTIKLTHEIAKLSIKYNIPLGFNANGRYNLQKEFSYPCKYFWEIISEYPEVKVVVEADSHSDKVLDINWMKEVQKLAYEYGLEKNLVNIIPIRWLKKDYQIKAFIFDLDGVIIDTKLLHVNSYNKVLASYDLSFSKEHLEMFKNLSVFDVFKQFLIQENMHEEITDRQIEQWVIKKEEYYEKEIKLINNSYLIDNIYNIMSSMKKEGYLIGVASSSRYAKEIINWLGLDHLIDYIADASKIKYQKPEPDIYLDVAKHLNVLPQECAAIEDTYNGLIAINDAMMYSVALTKNDQQMIDFADIHFDSTKEINYHTIIKKFNERK